MGSKTLLSTVILQICFHASNGATLGAGQKQMGMTELIQMKDELRDKLKSGATVNDTEVDTWQLFRDLFENTTIVYIKAEFADIGGALNNSWDVVTGCHATLQNSKSSSWSAESDDKNTKWRVHDQCRELQPDPNCNQTCSRCKAWAESLVQGGSDSTKSSPPTGSIEDGSGNNRVPVFNDCQDSTCWGNFGRDQHNTTITDWFNAYKSWHCTTDSLCPDGETSTQSLKPSDCWLDCTTRCSSEVGEWENNVTTCNNAQDDFEEALCSLATTMDSDCETYNQCRSGISGSIQGSDDDYKDEKARVLALEATLQAEYQMVRSCICLIDLLLTPNTQAISDGDIDNCGQYYPTPCPELALCIPEVANWDTAVNCECDNFPNSATCNCGDATNPGWCDSTECYTGAVISGDECSYKNRSPNLNDCSTFESLYYTSRPWYNSIGTCSSNDAVTPVTTQACSANRASSLGCSV